MKKHHQTVITQDFPQIKLGISCGNSLCCILSAPPKVAAGEETEARRAAPNPATFPESPERLCEVSRLLCTQAGRELSKSGTLLLPFAMRRVRSVCRGGGKVARTLLALNQAVRAAPLLLGREIMTWQGGLPVTKTKVCVQECSYASLFKEDPLLQRPRGARSWRTETGALF